MPLEGVRCTLHQVMAKSDSDLSSRSRHLCIEPLRLFPTPELCGTVRSPVEAFDRHLSVELEWMPTDLDCFFQDHDAFSKRRFAMKHHGQIKSEVTSTTRASAGCPILFATSIISEAPIFMVEFSD